MYVPSPSIQEGKEYFYDEKSNFSPEVESWPEYFVKKELGPIRLFYLAEGAKGLENYISGDYNGLLSAQPLNKLRGINKQFSAVNTLLSKGDYFVVSFEPQWARRDRLMSRRPKIFGYLDYYGWDFFFHRIIPRFRLTKPLYFLLTNGKNRVVSITEGLGRLVAGGFEIVDYKNDGGLTHVIARKAGDPKPTKGVNYGLLIKLTRIGYKGKKIRMYKVRTMRPYSEYIQKYLFDKHGTVDGDKIKNDFRVTKWGLYFRKFWIDELPMLWNFVKGDIKLVGVRPLSQHKFSTYPKALQKLRVKAKPGLIPPYYADLPGTQEKFFESEEDYLISYLNAPFKTDVKYFFKALSNIFLKGARSR